MRFCDEHWHALRAALVDRGLEQFIAKDAAEMATKIANQLSGNPTMADFDPILTATYRILETYIEQAAEADIESFKCPLCVVERTREGLALNWINGAADDQLKTARHHNLVPKPH